MKLSLPLTLVICVAALVGCAKTIEPVIAVDEPQKTVQPPQEKLAYLQQVSEQDSASGRSYVLAAKAKLSTLVGANKLEHYILKNGFLDCVGDASEASCVLNFYLTQVAKLESQKQINQLKAYYQQQLHKIPVSRDATQLLCQVSTDLVGELYAKQVGLAVDEQKITRNERLLQLSENHSKQVRQKIANDGYSLFLIGENKTVLNRVVANYQQQCLSNPQEYLINYKEIFQD